MFPDVEEEVQPEDEDLDKEFLSTPVTVKVRAPKSPPPGVNHTVAASAASGCTSLSRHYSRLKSAKFAQGLVGFPALGKLRCDTHAFFEGFHLLSANTKVCITMSHFRGVYL